MSDTGNRPIVTICVPTYNAARTLGETLSSILAQTYRDIRVMVVDNASSDSTLDVAGTIAASDSRVSIHPYKENVGAEGNFNRCIALAQGDYAAIYHADDLYGPEMVAREVAFLERNTDAAAVFTRAYLIDYRGGARGETRIPSLIKDARSPDTTFDFRTVFNAVLKEHNMFICSSAMVRTDVLREHVKIWDGVRFGTSADLGVWLRILEKYRIGIIPEPLMRYRLSAGQGSVVLNRLRTAPADFFRVIDHYLAQEWVRGMVLPENLAHYRIHEARDMHLRAKNLLILGERESARTLIGAAWKPELIAFPSWCREWRSLNLVFRTCCSGIFLSILSRLPRLRLIGSLLYHFKYARRSKKLGG